MTHSRDDVVTLTKSSQQRMSRVAFRDWLGHVHADLRSFRSAGEGSIEAEVNQQRALLRLLYEAGWTRWGWPRTAGGLGGDERSRAALYDELAAADVPLPEAFVLLETLAPVLVRYAPQLAVRHIPRYLRGEELWGQGFSEPEVGSDLASVRTRARLEGEEFRLTGQKVWTTLGQFAQWALVLCRTGPEAGRHGLSMLWVDLSVPGVEVRPIRAANGRDEFAEMFFEDVAVPRDNLIGQMGDGWSVAMYLLQFERGMYAWGRQAELHRVLRAAVAAADCGNDEAVAAVGTAFTSLCALRVRSVNTVHRLAAGETLGPDASIDKILLSRAEKHCYDAARLLHPEWFVLDDQGPAAALRCGWFFSRVTSIFGGAVEIQRSLIAERVLELPREPRRG